MVLKKLLKNNDAVSVSVSFILMFAITVIVFTATVLTFYSISQNSERNAMQESFKLLGGGLAVRITGIDALVNTIRTGGGSVNMLEYELSMPDSIAGNSYTVNITDDGIILEDETGSKFTVTLGISSNATGKIYSGAGIYQLDFDKENNSIVIKEK